MTKLLNPAPAAEPSVADAERLVAARADELAIIERDIASAESRRRELLVGDDDAAYESAEIALDRLGRKRHRAFVRLEVARTEYAEAKAREKEDRRKARYDAGLAAAAEVERLVGEYAKRAAAVVETLREIATHAETIRVADENRPPYSSWFDVAGLRIAASVVLPDLVAEDGYIWPQDEPASGAIDKSQPTIVHPVPKSTLQAVRQYGEHALPDGSRKIILPPNEWPPRPDSANA